MGRAAVSRHGTDRPILTEPEAFPRAFADAWATREGAAIAALFTDDADFVNVTGLWWHGRDAIAKPHDYALKSFFADTTLRIGRTETRYVGDDVAVVRTRLHLSGQRAPDGRPTGDRQTIITAVLRRDAGGWLAISAQNTEISPGMETHMAEGGTTRPVDYRR